MAFFKTLGTEEYFSSGHRACAGCAEPMIVRIVCKVAGPNSMIVTPTGCLEIFSTPYPQTAWRLPWIHVAFENAPAVASGIESALRVLRRKGRYEEGETNVIVIAGDGATFDIGFQSLSGMLERGHKVLYVCLDNEAYMNCLSTSSLIMTKEGLKKITEVKEGDEVYAFDQRSHQLVLKRCTGVFDNGEREVFEVETLHHTIRATSNHPFLVLKRNGRGQENELVWKELSQLKVGDEVVALESKHFKMEEIKRIKLIGKEPTLDLRVEGEHNFIADGIVVHNTGIQRSSATPYGAWTTTTPPGLYSIGKKTFKKNMPAIVAAHGIPYVATASIAFPLDLAKKVKKGLAKMPSYIQVLSPCPLGWRTDSNLTIKIAKLAVQTGYYPVYEIEDGRITVTIKIPERRPIAEFLKLQGRFRHLTEKDIKVVQEFVDKQCKQLGID